MKEIFVPALLAVAGALFATGLWCLLSQRHLVKMVLGVEMLGKGASLVFILGGRLAGDLPTAQSVVVTLIVIEAVVAGVALALVVRARHALGTLDAASLSAPQPGGEP